MKICIPVALMLICLAGVAGCKHVAKPSEGAIPSPTISDAVYLPGQLDTVRITGEYFKLKSDDKNDVVVSLNGRNWSPAKKILDSSPTFFVATVPYGPSFPNVWVRVFGMNREYSSVALIHVNKGR